MTQSEKNRKIHKYRFKILPSQSCMEIVCTALCGNLVDRVNASVNEMLKTKPE